MYHFFLLIMQCMLKHSARIKVHVDIGIQTTGVVLPSNFKTGHTGYICDIFCFKYVCDALFFVFQLKNTTTSPGFSPL